MKRLILALLATTSLALPALAQPTASPSPTTKKVGTIFDYKKEIGLSDDQEAKMKTALNELNVAVNAGRTKINKLETEYRTLLEKDPSVPVARAKLQEIAAAQVDLRLTDLMTSRRITGVLTPDQLEKWRAIQVKMRAANAPK